RRSGQRVPRSSRRVSALQIPTHASQLLQQIAKWHWRAEAADGEYLSTLIPLRGKLCKHDLRTLRKALSQKLPHPEVTAPKLNRDHCPGVSPTPCRRSPDSS